MGNGQTHEEAQQEGSELVKEFNDLKGGKKRLSTVVGSKVSYQDSALLCNNPLDLMEII